MADDVQAPKSRRGWLIAGAVAAVLVVAGGVIAVRSGNLDPEERAWPEAIDGRPWGIGEIGQASDQVTPTAAPGAYLWKDFDGWHLWVVNGDGMDGVQGTVSSDDDVAKARLSAPDTGTVSTDGGTVTFELSGEVPLAGLDFEPGFYAKEVTIDLRNAAGPLDPELLVVAGEPVDDLPFTVEKAVVEPEA